MESGVALNELMDRERLIEAIRVVRAQHPTLKPTQVDRLLVVMAFLKSRGVLEAVVQRERTLANPGLPDLVLWRRSPSRGVHGVHFVELKVKRKSRDVERLSPGQKGEIAFLSEIGLKARHVLMLER